MPILVDLSQIVMSGVITQLADDLERPNVEADSLIKHMVYTMLLGLKQKFGKEYGEMILCADSNKYWRREYFQWYKGHRKHAKEKAKIDWKVVYAALDALIVDLSEYFPYKVIEVENCEADDIIACLTHYYQENELDEGGLFGGSPKRIMICSSDGDFIQLQKYSNVAQWNNQHKKMVSSSNPKRDLLEKIASGDSGDNIPNVITENVWSQHRAENLEVKLRATPMKSARLEEFSELGEKACKTDEERANYARNDMLINFDNIPSHVYDSIINTYATYKKKGNTTKLMSYFTKNRMKVLFGDVASF